VLILSIWGELAHALGIMWGELIMEWELYFVIGGTWGTIDRENVVNYGFE